jgi:L-amino acid N-acyltransferase YncA
VLIREICLEDVGAARAIWNEVVIAADAFPQIEPLSTDAKALEFFQFQTRTAVAVDEESGQVLGLYILHPNNIGRCGHIANASYAVSDDARGKGVGRALVEDSIAKLALCGFTGLQFNAVVASNARAIALYEKLGFTKVGTIPGGFKNGEGALEDIHIFYHPATQAK